MISCFETGSSISVVDAIAKSWDVTILGAGVAGSSIGYHFATQGMSSRTLLFILDRINKVSIKARNCAMVAFGPGIHGELLFFEG